MLCQATTTRSNQPICCTRKPHAPHEFHSTLAEIDGAVKFITWRDRSILFIRAMEEMEATDFCMSQDLVHTLPACERPD